MRKLVTVFFIGLLCLGASAQVKEIPHKVKLKHYHNWGGIRADYEAVRIGEYYWINKNLHHQKVRLENVTWKGINEVEFATQGQLDTYMGHLKLGKEQFQVNMDTFNYYYGAYYHEHSIRGFWSEWGNHVYPIDTYAPMTYEDGSSAAAFGLPTNDDFRQLFAMVPLAGNSRILNELDVRINLAPKKGENPMAYDLWTDSHHRTYWFEQSTNLYGFNLMPGGGRVDYYKWEDITGTGAWPLYHGDFYQLFYVAKFATKDGSVDIEDWLHFYPERPGEIGIDNGTWYNVRFCRRLTPEELGYRLYYNNDDKDPDIIKQTKNINNTTPPKGYTELAPGYLRGFYVQYILDQKNPKHSLRDIVQFSKCVKEFGAEPDCDCTLPLPADIIDNVRLMTDTDNSVKVYKDKAFTVSAPNNVPGEVKIGLFDMDGTFVERIDVNRNDCDYNCVISMDNRTGIHLIQPYIIVKKDEESVIVPVERLSSDRNSHLIDKLLVQYYPSAKSIAQTDALNGHLQLKFDPNGHVDKHFIHSVNKQEPFLVAVPDAGDDVMIGLYTIEGYFVCDIYDERYSSRNGNDFECEIPEDIDGNGEYIIIPYVGNPKQEDSKVSRKASTTLFDRVAIVDRLSVYVKDDADYWDSWSKAFSMPAKEEKENMSISLFPNPAYNSIRINGEFEKVLCVEIYNISGNLVKRVNNTDHLDISNLASGLYTVKVTTDRGTGSGTIMKK